MERSVFCLSLLPMGKEKSNSQRIIKQNLRLDVKIPVVAEEGCLKS